MTGDRFDLVKVDKYFAKGVQRSKSYSVGKAVKMRKGGYMLFVPDGIAVSGRILMVPERTTLNEIDLIEAYECAADELSA